MTLTTQYGDFVTLARTLIDQFGVTVKYVRFDEDVAGHEVGGDNRVEESFQLKLFMRGKFLRRMADSFKPSFEATALMANNNFDPKPQDYIVEPDGKQSVVVQIQAVAPDVFPIFYYLGFRDG